MKDFVKKCFFQILNNIKNENENENESKIIKKHTDIILYLQKRNFFDGEIPFFPSVVTAKERMFKYCYAYYVFYNNIFEEGDQSIQVYIENNFSYKIIEYYNEEKYLFIKEDTTFFEKYFIFFFNQLGDYRYFHERVLLEFLSTTKENQKKINVFVEKR